MKLNVNYFSKWLLVVMAMGLCNFAMAQRSISGTVTDASSGETLIGANILVVGTSTGTITDFDGNFTLQLPEGATELEISYTGYATQKVAIGDATTLNIEMSAGELLDEVVVVGYGTLTTKEVTSAVTSVKAEDFNNGNVNDAASLVQGKVAGLSIANVGGDPNSNPTIRLRGLSSFGANTEPLVVIDGVIGASLSTVDPADIESIDVLKDGSAAAIYGVRASAGVILVTTKSGKEGRAQVNYRGYVASESISRQPELASPQRFVEINGQGQNFGGSTDWIDEVTRTGLSHVHNLSIAGGSGSTTYRASVNYRDIQGIGNVSEFQQLNARLNLSQKAINDRLTLDFNVTTTDRKSNFGFNEIFRYAIVYNPTAPATVAGATGVPSELVDRSNSVFGGYFQAENFDYFNPVAIQDLNENTGEATDFLASFRATFDLTDDLSVSAFYSSQRENDLNGEFYAREDYFRGGAAGADNLKGRARRFEDNFENELFEVTATFNRDFGNTGFELLGGYSYNEFRQQQFFVEGRGLPSNAFGFNNLNVLNDRVLGQIQTSSFQDLYKVIGFFGRARLDFDGRFFVTGSLRYDGTSRNGDDKWGLFPAISVGADLVDLLSADFADNLKLRAGYGETGSIPRASFLSQPTLIVQGQFPIDGNSTPAVLSERNANPLLVFERKREFNVGVDFAFADYRLTGSVDYYIRNTGDLQVDANVATPPNIFPTSLVNLNNVELRSTGVELALGYAFGGENFSWEPNLVFSTFSVTLEDNGEAADFPFGSGGVLQRPQSSPGAPGQNDDPTVRVAVGEPMGQIWTRVVDLDATRESGQFTYVDQNGDGVIDEADKVVVGNGLPDFSIGLNNSFKFGNFDASFFIRGDFGHELANMYRNFYEPLGARAIENNIQTEFFLDGVAGLPEFSDYYVEDASFLVLDNAQIGYTFNLPETSGFRNIRFYLAGQRLFWITDYTGVDPNVRYADPGSTDNGNRINLNPDPLVIGLDRRNNYFNTRTITFGVNVGF